ncbi:hypothetical protein AVEN_24541-1, partial [Araneus ventricosus]
CKIPSCASILHFSAEEFITASLLSTTQVQAPLLPFKLFIRILPSDPLQAMERSRGKNGPPQSQVVSLSPHHLSNCSADCY